MSDPQPDINRLPYRWGEHNKVRVILIDLGYALVAFTVTTLLQGSTPPSNGRSMVHTTPATFFKCVTGPLTNTLDHPGPYF